MIVDDARRPFTWTAINMLLKLVTDAHREYREGKDVPYLPAALEVMAGMLRQYMAGADHVLDTMRSKLATVDPHFYEAMDKLGFADPRKAWEEAQPVPWQHDWTEDDFDEEEDDTVEASTNSNGHD